MYDRAITILTAHICCLTTCLFSYATCADSLYLLTITVSPSLLLCVDLIIILCVLKKNYSNKSSEATTSPLTLQAVNCNDTVLKSTIVDWYPQHHGHVSSQ